MRRIAAELTSYFKKTVFAVVFAVTLPHKDAAQPASASPPYTQRMRPFLAALLLSPCLLSQCSQAPATSSIEEKPAVATDSARTQTGFASEVGPLESSPKQQQVQPSILFQEPTAYAAILPVLRDKDGTIKLNITLNPKTHSVQELKALFIPLNKNLTYKQVGEGISRYDEPTGRYYFATTYQKIRQLSANSTSHEDLRQVVGWVEPGTAKAAVAEEAVAEPAK